MSATRVRAVRTPEPSPGLPSGLSQRARRVQTSPISDLMHRALARPELISLAAGFVDQQTLPVETVGIAWNALQANEAAARAALQYGTTPGLPRLREQVLSRWLHADGLSLADSGITVDQVVMTAGSNQLLHLVSECLLDPGDIVLCAKPTYFVYLGTLSDLGAIPLGVETDEHGMLPEALDAQLAHLHRRGLLPRVKLVYLVSYFDNPSGVTTALERRPQLVEVVRRWSNVQTIRILEDAAYRELRYSGEDVPSLRSFDPTGETVIVAQTFSKSFAPGVRVGFGILPRDLVDPFCCLKSNIDFGSPQLAQALLAEVFDRGLFEPHVERLKAGYRPKMEAMVAAAETHLAPLPGVKFTYPTGGLYVWVTLPPNVDAGPAGKLFDLAFAEGMLYVPGQYCYPGPDLPPRNTLRLSFGVQSPERIEQGVAALARAVRTALAEAG